MSFIIVLSHTEEPRDWVALHPKTYDLIDRAPTLKELTDRIGKGKYLITKNHYRPIPLKDLTPDEKI